MAAKALNRPVHGFAVRKRPLQAPGGEKVGWDELEAYESKASWRELGLEKGMGDVEAVRSLEEAGWEGMAAVDRRWGTSWECDRMSKWVVSTLKMTGILIASLLQIGFTAENPAKDETH